MVICFVSTLKFWNEFQNLLHTCSCTLESSLLQPFPCHNKHPERCERRGSQSGTLHFERQMAAVVDGCASKMVDILLLQKFYIIIIHKISLKRQPPHNNHKAIPLLSRYLTTPPLDRMTLIGYPSILIPCEQAKTLPFLVLYAWLVITM